MKSSNGSSLPTHSVPGRLACVVALAFFVGATASAEEAGLAGTDELRRRLDEAEARILALEELTKHQSEQLAVLYASGNPTAPTSLLAVANSSSLAPGLPQQSAPPEKEKKAEIDSQAPPERPVTHPIQAIRFDGLVQAWYVAGNLGLPDTFRIRRAELYLSGDITRKARWQVMVDPSKALSLDASFTMVAGSPLLSGVAVSQASRILQNALVSFDYVPKQVFTLGQFKIPLSLEGLQSSGRLETVERALFASDRARGGTYGDVRDLGIMFAGAVGKQVNYQAGVFNGVAETQNTVDLNDQKAAVGRVVGRPLDGLHLGASGAFANRVGLAPRRDRLGGEFQLKRGPVLLQSELMTGHDGPIYRRGFYGHVGYKFRPKFEWVFRVDGWDPDTASQATPATVSELDYVTGFNVFLSQNNLKFQVNYIRKTFGSDALPARNVVLVNTQTFW